MAILYIDVATSKASQFWTQITELSGREYVFAFRWNARAESWYLDVSDQDSSPIATGVRLVCDQPLAREVVGDSRMWTGTLMCASTTDDDSDPGLLDLGERVVLFYDDGEAVAA